MTLSRSHLRSGARFTVAATILASGAFLLPSLLASSATAEDGRRGDDLADLSACDLSACYLALGVVDTDGDGVADADEIVLGYDPLDPESTPPLQLLLDTTLADTLPTYELGYGTWAVFSEEFLMRLEEEWIDLYGPTLPTEVFGISTRRETFAVAGIDDGLLKAAGIDLPWTNGLTFGLAALTAEGKEMGLDLGRFNGSWYSNISDRGTRWWAATHGGVAADNPGDGPDTENYGDLSKSKTREVPCDLLCTSRHETDYEDKDGKKAGSSSHTTSVDLNLGYHVDIVMKDKDGNVVKESHTVHSTDKKGNHVTTTTTTEYRRDANGKVTGSTKTTTTKTEGKEGKTSNTKKQNCDKNGENCTDAMTTGEEGGYLALPGSYWLANKEMAAALDKLITLKGAAVTPVEDAPTVIGVVTDDDVDAILHRRDLISLFAGDDIATHVGAMVLGTGWNKAKPETRPDLPSPLDGAAIGGGPGGGCSSGVGTC